MKSELTTNLHPRFCFPLPRGNFPILVVERNSVLVVRVIYITNENKFFLLAVALRKQS